MEDFMLTTIDNPFDPFTQFDEWYRFDTDHGYNTCAYLARVSVDASSLGEEEEKLEINRAIDEILKFNVLGIYKKVSRQKAV